MFGKKAINDFKIIMIGGKELIVNLPTSGSNNAYEFLNNNSSKGLCYLGGYIKDGTDITINLNNVIAVETVE